MKKLNILVVDDNQDSLTYLCEIIDRLGYNVLLADRGCSALAIINNTLPDLILLDIQIPDIDGFGICKFIKSSKKLVDIPVVFLSATSDISEKIKAFQVGGVDYITKPFHKDELLIRIETHLKHSYFNRLQKRKTEKRILRIETELRQKNKLLEESHKNLKEIQKVLQEKELKLKKVNKELSDAKGIAEKNERCLRQLIKYVPIPIVVTDTKQNIDFFNEKFTQEFGYSKKDIATVEEWWNAACPNGKYREQVISSWKDAVDRSIKNNTEIDMQVWQLTPKDDLKHFCEFSMVSIGEKNLIVVNDITDKVNVLKELRKQIKELKKAKVKAEENDRLKSAFLANMSHEIRTPMNAIVGFATFLVDTKKSREDLCRYAKVIINSGNHLLNLIDNIIDISKIDASEVELSILPFDLHITINELYDFFNTKLIEKNKNQIVLKKHFGCSSCYIKTDETRLRQILINLIDNAIKFTELGSVEFGYDIEGQDIIFFVKDTGVGIPQSKLDVIFERFRQAEASVERTYGGTGLGLSIAKACSQLLGGSIWVDSEKDSGTKFYFTIPYVSGGELAMERKTEAEAEFFNGESILLVEDDPIHVQYMKELLSIYNVHIIHVNNGRDAVEKAVEKDIKLVLMDVQLPLLNGWEATTRIKRIRPELPIIAQTAYAFENDRMKSINAGCDAYLSKPIDCNKLIATMKNIVENSVCEKTCM